MLLIVTGDYHFAKLLDNDILLFTNLRKGKFLIDTALENYHTNYAVVYRLDEDEAGIYFIVETKRDKKLEDLTDIEKGKIYFP